MLVSKWGASLAVRLPKELVNELGLKPGDELAIVDASKERLLVEKSERRARALDQLRALNWTLPADYKFDRDEANER
ncbi:MAG: AbrB/MazE/SpoVT family DNA-binding domain-containing protein [Alphaproteobacteria bacterium]|nr:AbrB/MazE/SpoVT family DNA-binding domain-containing protein [Alphaproteobacteria bacterium]MBM3653463.1 AbrB/MazE/SpoVT family DNA-binding domain-containing protein [Alphaproteobacteria bacterium]